MSISSDILKQKLLVVGAGGIGCELLKNLAMAGFLDIEVIDLDTIDVSNLNRQFLFRREHVGMPKAQVAAEAVRAMRPNMKIVYHHDSIFNSKYDITFFKSFAVVLNALDNLGARRHVNHLCVCGRVPLIDGGTTGYIGQVRVIKRQITECFDCVEHPVPKSFPTCTIRNTPSEFIHCITWAKFLFNQLFGEPDPDEDVAPMEEVAENGTENGGDSSQHNNQISTRQFAASHKYNPQEIYNKLFVRDIEYLLQMEDLWKDRRPPVPYRIDDLSSIPESSAELPLNTTWSIEKWITEFVLSVQALAERFENESKEGRVLSWDKDDNSALRFVAACANIRAWNFQIPGKSLFDVKSMAGNIIPAIATSNAIVAGLMVVETFKIIMGQDDKFKSAFISIKPSVHGKIINDDAIVKPNPKCTVCQEKREIFVKLNIEQMDQKTFVERVLKDEIGMISPDVTNLATGDIIINSEGPENPELGARKLSDLNVSKGCQLQCEDFDQPVEFQLFILHDDSFGADNFKIVMDSGNLTKNGNGHVKVVSEEDEDQKRKRVADEIGQGGSPKRARIEV